MPRRNAGSRGPWARSARKFPPPQKGAFAPRSGLHGNSRAKRTPKSWIGTLLAPKRGYRTTPPLQQVNSRLKITRKSRIGLSSRESAGFWWPLPASTAPSLNRTFARGGRPSRIPRVRPVREFTCRTWQAPRRPRDPAPRAPGRYGDPPLSLEEMTIRSKSTRFA